jgi:hypothetical protein
MNLESHKIFAQLCEAYLNEASTAMNLIAGKSGGPEVVRKLHKDMKLAHDLGYSPIDKISWSDLKGARNGAWVILQADNGTGAIRAINDRYEAVASTGGEVKTYSDGKGGNILDFLKNEIGKPRKFFVAKNTRDVDTKKQKRAELNKGVGQQEVTKDTLVMKFRPLWIRAMTAAIADIKGHVANMIKNDAFDKAKKKLGYLDSLYASLEELQAGATDTSEYVDRAVNMAVLMAASHHFPEQTGNIERSRWGGGVSAQFSEGPQLLLKAISGGDTAKLGTVLGFFKKALITG